MNRRKFILLLLAMAVAFGVTGCEKSVGNAEGQDIGTKTDCEETDMRSLFESYNALDIDTSLIQLEKREDFYVYDCYPVNAKPIGFEGCILYCFIDGYDEMVFAANPENYGEDGQVYPLARNFEDFLGLVVACGSANPVEQIGNMTREQFENHVKITWDSCGEEERTVLEKIKTELGISPMEDPYGYVQEVQKDFDGSKIIYSDAYYETLGMQREGSQPEEEKETWVVQFVMEKEERL